MRRWMRQLQRSTVVVHLVDGASLRGVLVGEHTDCLVLAHATYIAAGPGDAIATMPVDGQAVLPREKVVWLQLLPSTTQEAT